MNKQQALASKVFSFDVFDTCVTRCCARPSDLFERLFVVLLAQKQFSGCELTAAAKTLARSRIAAETAARQQATSDDITLFAIYQGLAPSLELYGISAAEAEAAEIELELVTVSPILFTWLRIQHLRSQGRRIVFISDMYLPGHVVRQMLVDHGFSDGSDEVYVSADVGLSKGSGRLFPYVCEQLGIAPKQLHHTGDNRYADVRAAQRQGVSTTHFTQGDPNRYECGFRAELVGNDWMRSHLIGLSRAVRLGRESGSAHTHHHVTLAANVMAPLVTGYLFWVLTTAREMGLTHLYFADAGLLSMAQTICQSGFSQTGWNSPVAGVLPVCEALIAADTTKKPSAATSYGFILLDGVEQSLIMSDRPTLLSSYLAYIEAPIKLRKQPEGTAYLFKYASILVSLLSALSNADEPIYAAVVSDYIDAFMRFSYSEAVSGDLDSYSSLSPRGFNQLKQYALNNVIRLLANPTAADVKAIVELQPDTNVRTAQIRPIRLWELPTLSKQLMKGRTSSSQRPWHEGAIALSPVPIQTFFVGLRRLKDAM